MREMPYKVALLQPASVAIDTNAAVLAFAAASPPPLFLSRESQTHLDRLRWSIRDNRYLSCFLD